MRVIFSPHAEYQLKERELSKADIRYVLRKPDNLVRQSANRFAAMRLMKKSKKQFLFIVVYDITGKGQEVVTAFLTSKIKKYL